MPEKVASNSGRKLVVGVLLIALVTLLGVIAFRRYEAERPTPETPAVQSRVAGQSPPASQPAAAPPLAPPPVLGRAELLAAIARAASAYAAGEDRETQSPLTRRRFRLVLPFGCNGPRDLAENASGYWTYGQDGRTIRVVVAAEDWTRSDFAQGLGAEVERVEGFWIPRPWLLTEACPAARSDPLAPEAATAPAAPQTAGLARVFEQAGSRLSQRGGRPYEVTIPAPEQGVPPAQQGFQLVLEGRIVGFADERVIACRSSSPDQPPVCLIGADVERVAIVDSASKTVLGEWRS